MKKWTSWNKWQMSTKMRYIAKKTKVCYYVTVSNHRPRSCRWEGSIFGATWKDLVAEIDGLWYRLR